MTLNKNNLFYVRNLQKKMYFPNDEFISALFMLEKFLFDNFSFTEEAPLKIIKQKWIYDSIDGPIREFCQKFVYSFVNNECHENDDTIDYGENDRSYKS